jgi:hypothetical protein
MPRIISRKAAHACRCGVDQNVLLLKTDHAPIVFGRRAHVLPLSRQEARH